MIKKASVLRRIIVHLLFMTAAAELTAFFFFTFPSPDQTLNNYFFRNHDLFFENQASLPVAVLPNKDYSFTFIIQNNESHGMNYTYEVYMQSQNSIAPIDSGSVFIEPGKVKSIKEIYSVVNNVRNSRVIVRLTNRNKVIAFNVN